jgi:hypothetical protein
MKRCKKEYEHDMNAVIHPDQLVEYLLTRAIDKRYSGDSHTAGGIDHLTIQGDDVKSSRRFICRFEQREGMADVQFLWLGFVKDVRTSNTTLCFRCGPSAAGVYAHLLAGDGPTVGLSVVVVAFLGRRVWGDLVCCPTALAGGYSTLMMGGSTALDVGDGEHVAPFIHVLRGEDMWFDMVSGYVEERERLWLLEAGSEVCFCAN